MLSLPIVTKQPNNISLWPLAINLLKLVDLFPIKKILVLLHKILTMYYRFQVTAS